MTKDTLGLVSPTDTLWLRAYQALQAEIAAVDREALGVWLGLFPCLMEELSPDAAGEVYYQIRGSWRLGAQADSSHYFLYASAWWPAAKKALRETLQANPPAGSDPVPQIRSLAQRIEAPDAHRLTLAFVALKTLAQCGPGFLGTAGDSQPTVAQRSEKQVAELRIGKAKVGFLTKLFAKPTQHRVTFDELRTDEHFPALDSQEITTAAEADKRPYHLADERCYEGMGPIPVDCRSGSCGTCWVGILGGRENLDEAGEYERKRMEYFGYWDSGFGDEESTHPRLRLACQAKVHGPVSLVIPSWNGVYGKSRREREKRKGNE
ncbi:MAG: 2Fe-2S iron-sulfur cluster-binding protein [Bryobacter sp.]|nr:2Fe-2S iron-sulfur cluster-binding protein [Bryobacter sp.]